MALALIVTALSVACGDDDGSDDYPNEVQLTDSDDGSTVQLAVAGTLIVALESNPTTGFSWSVSETSDPQLVLQGEPEYVPAGSTTPVVGAGGTEVFTFDAKDTGRAHLVLEYKRPFEPDTPPDHVFSVTVEIR